jgi:hypothetical protein
MLCSMPRVNHSFGGTYQIFLQGVKNKPSKNPVRNKEQASWLSADCIFITLNPIRYDPLSVILNDYSVDINLHVPKYAYWFSDSKYTGSNMVSADGEISCELLITLLIERKMYLSSETGSCLLHIGCPLWREDESVICSAITHRLESRRTHNHISLSHLRLPQPGEPGSRIYIPRNRMAQLCPQALGSLFVAFYNSQGYGLFKFKLYCDRLSVSQFVLVSGPWSQGVLHEEESVTEINLKSGHLPQRGPGTKMNWPTDVSRNTTQQLKETRTPSGGGLEYLHRSPANHKRRRKWKVRSVQSSGRFEFPYLKMIKVNRINIYFF